MADCFKLGKTTNQYKRLCSDVLPYFANYSIEEEPYSEIEEHQDNDYEEGELNVDQKQSEFLHDFSLATNQYEDLILTSEFSEQTLTQNYTQKLILKS